MPTRTEEAASKAMGVVKTVKATVEGLHGIFKRLTEEHGEAMALLTRIKLSSEANVRARLFPEVKSQLLAHEKGELRAVYPVFADHAELASFSVEHQNEASELERLLDRLDATGYDSESWETMFDQLVELVREHTKREEDDFFPAGERVLGREEAERLESLYATAKTAPIA